MHSIGIPEVVESTYDTCNDNKRKRAVKSMAITKWPKQLVALETIHSTRPKNCIPYSHIARVAAV